MLLLLLMILVVVAGVIIVVVCKASVDILDDVNKLLGQLSLHHA